MASLSPLYELFNLQVSRMTKEERVKLDLYLLIQVHEYLREVLKRKNNILFSLKEKNHHHMEFDMFELEITRFLINDILATEDYTIEGIATYAYSHPDVIIDVAAGRQMPSANLFRRILNLHILVRREQYKSIVMKILLENGMEKMLPQSFNEANVTP